MSRGIIPGAGGTQRLPRLIPLGKSLEMILTGDRIDARKLIGSGLSTGLWLLINCSPKPRNWLNGSAGMRPLPYRPAKEAVYRGMDLPLSAGLRLEQFLAEPIFQSEDAKEGPRAFFEKRPALFKGK